MDTGSVLAIIAAGLACVFALLAWVGVNGAVAKINKRSEELSERNERSGREGFAQAERNHQESMRSLREELNGTVSTMGRGMQEQITQLINLQRGQLEDFGKRINILTDKNEQKLEQMSQKVELRIKDLQDQNNVRLETIRKTVDEQLNETLKKRLDDSFAMVSQRLEQVYKGLGEMQSLATGVGDLKKVLSNVKTRGTWGEYQLGNLLEQMLAPSQYEANVAIPKNGKERVEYAVRLPGKDEGDVWLPIDAKFPQEDYLRLVEASEIGDPETVKACVKQLESALKVCAKQIRDKYVRPPYTTDFGIMYLPIEGLYAEALRVPGLTEYLQREMHVVPAGPTTLSALLNSLQMGFRTLAIQKRSNEVWNLLGTFKTEFNRFTESIIKAQKKLHEASETMDSMGKRTISIQRKLRDVEQMPALDGEVVDATDLFLPEEGEA